jgi:hypothetical protein
MLDRDNYTWHDLIRPPDKYQLNESMLERDNYTWHELIRPTDK